MPSRNTRMRTTIHLLPWPAHVHVLRRESRDRVWELHGGGVVLFEQAPPSERGECAGQFAYRQRLAAGQVDVVDRPSQFDQVVGAALEGRRPGAIARAVRVDRAEFLPVDG